MEGYLDLKIAPWAPPAVTRSLALVPAVLTIALVGEASTQTLLVLSQVVLSLQLSFAVIPLIHFTSNRRNMGEFATPWWGQVLAWGIGHDDRRPEREARLDKIARMGDDGRGVGSVARADAAVLGGRLAPVLGSPPRPWRSWPG